MPVAMTFNSLIADTRRTIERGGSSDDPSTATQLPFIVNTVERRMARELKIQGFQAYYVSAFQQAVNSYQKPARWRETISMTVSVQVGSATTYTKTNVLVPMAFEALVAYWPTATSQATPRYYADFGYSNFAVAPTPTGANPYMMAYWELPALLDAVNTTNWTTTYAPNALFHGTVAETYRFLGNTAKAAEWDAQYDRDMAALSGEDIQKILDRSEQRNTS